MFVRKAEYVFTAVAYLTTTIGARKLLPQGTVDQPVGNCMAWEAAPGRLHSYVIIDKGDADDQWAGGVVRQCWLGDRDVEASTHHVAH